MAEGKPVILLLPGAWHQGWLYDIVAEKLRAVGYQAEGITLPSAGGSASASAYDDANHIRDAYLNRLVAEGKEVIIYMHSYGGVPGTECVKGFARKDLAAQGKKGGVISLIYQSALIVPAGVSVQSFLPSEFEGSMILREEKMYPKDPREKFYSDLSDDEASKYVAKLVHHSLEAARTPLTYEAYRDVPSNFIFCTEDAGFPYQGQQKIVLMLGNGAQTYTIDSGHCPMLSQPDAVVDAIQDIATKAAST